MSKAAVRPGLVARRTTREPPGTAGRCWTYAEAATELPESNAPTELWDGEIIMSPSPSFFHQVIVDRFHDALKGWVRRHRLGRTGTAPLDMVLAPRQAVQPDVVFVASARLGIIRERIEGPADLVVEVISPGTRQRDRGEKRDLYERHGVKEYWLLEPETRTVEVLFLERGEYRLAGRGKPGEEAASRLLPGFTLPVGPLFDQDLD